MADFELFKKKHSSALLRRSWNFSFSGLSELVAFDKLFFRQIINLETDKKRKAFLRRRFREIVYFEIWLDNYLETLWVLSDHDDEK